MKKVISVLTTFYIDEKSDFCIDYIRSTYSSWWFTPRLDLRRPSYFRLK